MILLLAGTLLLTAPEQVTIVARKSPEKRSVLAKAGEKLGAAWHRLFQKEDSEVAKGNALAAQSDAEGALKQYEAARARLPENPALAFDRASALLQLSDASKAPEAASEAGQALQKGEGALKAKAAYDLALATEAMGRADDAIKAYGSALALDPEDQDSKVNLELLLKSQEERKQKQQQAKQQEDKQQKEQQQEQQEKKDEQKEEKKEQEKQQQAKQELKEKKQQPQPEEKPVDRSEAERLLDALRAGEKNLQTWRFAKEKRKETHRGEFEKDW